MNRVANKGYNNKKAQGLSLDMIVVGAIALVVLVVIVTMFTTYSRRTGTQLANVSGGANCTTHGGHMTTIGYCEEIGGTPIVGNFYGTVDTYDTSQKKWTTGTNTVKADGLTYVCCKI